MDTTPPQWPPQPVMAGTAPQPHAPGGTMPSSPTNLVPNHGVAPGAPPQPRMPG